MTFSFSVRRRRFLSALLVAATVAATMVMSTSVSAQQPVTIKMATLVPTNSSWFLVLKEVADKWNKLSNGRVKVVLYGGGTKGDDPEVVQAMRLGELQGAVLTSVGVAEIEKSVYAISIPMAFDSYEEVYAVLDRMRPRLEAAMEAKGFVVLNFADAGWIQFFTTKPVASPDDLKKLTLFQWAGDSKSLEIWKAAGFNVRPAAVTDLPTGLSTGLFQACTLSPQVAQIGRYYEKAKFMTDLKWALLLGATVIKKDTWAQVPADIRPALLKAMQEAGAKLQADIRQNADKDIAAMKSAGLTVVPVDPKTKDLWRRTAESTYGKIRGDFVPVDAFDEAMKARDEYRKAHAAPAPKK
jgi:TRAP-type transport system periplasmic protein